ncbi:patatin-like phospholipase family protein [Kineococcus sp. T13]|uniref:patatin-like phospholipase family protein n=1 Tax=Kineococcus vitellinus TaxID=2696565 RepID=UPI001412EAAE|nr:patatin-like phospholipase family protein [Kineococcus vitellinus]
MGFVMGGGGSLGAVQVGMVSALQQHGILPEQITGTSVGALNGAVLAAHGENGPALLASMWKNLTRESVFPGSLVSAVLRLRRTRTHAVSAAALEALVLSTLDTGTFEGLDAPLAVLALDLSTGDEHVLDSGPLVPALLASAAIPGVFPAVRVSGRDLVDGGVVANVPVRHAAARGAGCLVLLDTTVPAPAGSGSPGIGDILARVAQIQFRAQLMAALPAVAARVPVVCLPAPGARRVDPTSFEQSAALSRDAHERTDAFLADLHVDGPGIYGEPFARYVAGAANAPATAVPVIGAS